LRFFAPQRRHVAPMGGEIWHGGGDLPFGAFAPPQDNRINRSRRNFACKCRPRVCASVGEVPLLGAKFHPHRCNDKGVGPKNQNFYTDLTKMWNINAPQGRIPCAIFTKFEFVPPFQDALDVKIRLDLFEGLWSYGGFNLRGSGYPQIFSAP